MKGNLIISTGSSYILVTDRQTDRHRQKPYVPPKGRQAIISGHGEFGTLMTGPSTKGQSQGWAPYFLDMMQYLPHMYYVIYSTCQNIANILRKCVKLQFN